MSHRILLLHATKVAIAPIRNAFADLWPDADIINVLDDSLSIDRAREQGPISDAMIERFVRFGRHGYDESVDGILATCSAFGPAIEQLAEIVPVPVLKPNEAMFRSAITKGSTIGMLVTFEPAVIPMENEFSEFIRDAGHNINLKTVIVEGAMAHLQAGNLDAHDELVATHSRDLTCCDAIMLAQFSTARAFSAVQSAVDVPVLTAPHAAVSWMRDLVVSKSN